MLLQMQGQYTFLQTCGLHAVHKLHAVARTKIVRLDLATRRSLGSGGGGSMQGGAMGLDHQAMARQQMEQQLREMQVTADLVQQQFGS